MNVTYITLYLISTLLGAFCALIIILLCEFIYDKYKQNKNKSNHIEGYKRIYMWNWWCQCSTRKYIAR